MPEIRDSSKKFLIRTALFRLEVGQRFVMCFTVLTASPQTKISTLTGLANIWAYPLYVSVRGYPLFSLARSVLLRTVTC